MSNCRVAALFRRISMPFIALNTEFKDFKDHFQNPRTFQGSSRIFTKIQGLFKDFKDRHEIQGFQGFFQGCGNPALETVRFGEDQMFPVVLVLQIAKVM